MDQPFSAGPNLAPEVWREMRLRAIFDYCKWDPHCGDQEVLAPFPLILQEGTVQQLAHLAEDLTREALAAEEEILSRRRLLARLSIPAAIQRCMGATRRTDRPRDVRVMRFDFHFTTDGWQISEVNADVPGGYVEASGWNALFAEQSAGMQTSLDPTCEYAKAICSELSEGSLVSLAHATVYSEDRQVMVHLGRELQRREMRVCLNSPRNISWSNGAAMFKTDFRTDSPDFLVRLSPAEWLPGEGESWPGWFRASKTAMSNPGCALILQSKRFPLVWDSLTYTLPTWSSLLPETRHPAEVREIANGEWVVKPAFGRVGEDVGIRGVTPAEEYKQILQVMQNKPEQWIAQRKFEVVPVPTETGEVFPCVGVYTVNGKFAGLYGRAARSPLINESAQDVAVLIRNEQSGSV